MNNIKLQVKTFFRGGIHPKENKNYTENIPIENFHLPLKAIIPLNQHFGKPAIPIVKKGDIITEGQLIGQKDGAFSANIHSSIGGKVVDVGNYFTCNNTKTLSVVVQLEGEMKKGPEEKRDWTSLSRDDIMKKITEAGIVGMGGATFPTDVKLNPPKDKKIDYFIVNGVECEPYLTCDYRLMLEKTEEFIEGINIVQKILDVKNVFIGIELNKKKAIKKLLDQYPEIKVVGLKVKYPQGGEKQLIKAVIGKEVPSGGLPFDVGVVVNNVATVIAIRDAVVLNKPLTERVVTISGKIVKKPGNYKIKIGTPLSDIINEVGLTEEPAKVIFGGPMMGIAVTSLDTPVTKATSGILFLSKKEEKKIHYNQYRACVHCAKCIMVCPVSINPCMLSITGEFEKYDEMKQYNIMDCIECGCCNYICPSFRPIVQWIKIGKAVLKSK